MTATTIPVAAPVDAPTAGPGFLRTTARVAALELRLLAREPGVLVWLVAFPAVSVLILAGVFGSEPDKAFAMVRPSEHYVVGYLGVVLAQMGLVTLPAHLASHRERGILRRYRSAGVGAGAAVASQAVLGTVLGLGGAAVVLAVGGAVYGVPTPAHPLAVAGWLAAGTACFVALGLALGSLLPSTRAATAVGNLVFIPMFLLGGGGPPRGVMTGVMQPLSDALPLTHVIGGLRQAWLGAGTDPAALWWPATVAALAVALALVVARRRAG
jgi:ABC-2 type transport system permease protein